MYNLIGLFVKNGILFIQNSVGTVRSPYRTYRRLSEGRNPGQLLFIGGLVAAYFSWGSVVRVGISHPLLLTKNYGINSAAAGLTFALVVGGIFGVGKLLNGKGRVGNIVLPWGYSLWPTVIWFFITAWSYFLLPPPRTGSLAGRLFSFLFVVLSLVLFFWKGLLYYLTLRFGMRLDLSRILVASAIIFPAGIAYSLVMYRLGIFRIPFI